MTNNDKTTLTPKTPKTPKKRGRKPSIKKTSLSDAINLFETNLNEEDKSALTVKNYLVDLNSFKAWLSKKDGKGGKDTKDVKVTELDWAGQSFQAYSQYLKRSKVAPTTTNRRIIAIRKFFEFLYTFDYVDVRYGENIAMKKVQGGGQHSVKWLKREDVSKILDSIPKLPRITEERIARNKAIILVLVNCGLRVKELTDLKIGDIDVAKGILTVRSGKGDKFRQVPITNGTLAALDEWLKFRTESGKLFKDAYIFTSEKGDKFSERGVQHLTKNLSNLSGVEFSPHTLRHTYCKQIADSTGKIQLVAELAGHSNINTTRIYTAPSFEELTKVVEGVEFTNTTNKTEE